MSIFATTPTTAPAPASFEVPGGPAATLSLTDLRLLRRRLRDESERAAHWHRLARARLDLVVAGALAHDLAARPEVGTLAPADTAEHTTDDAATPCFESLRALLLGDALDGQDVVDRLNKLDDAERLLRGYGASVRAASDAATDELVRRYTDEPSTCLAAVPAHL